MYFIINYVYYLSNGYLYNILGMIKDLAYKYI